MLKDFLFLSVFSSESRSPKSSLLNQGSRRQYSFFTGEIGHTSHNDYDLWWYSHTIGSDSSKSWWFGRHWRKGSKGVRYGRTQFLYSQCGLSIRNYIFFACNSRVWFRHHRLQKRKEEDWGENQRLWQVHHVPSLLEVYIKFRDKNFHVVVPDLEDSRMQGSEDPRSSGMERDSFNSLRLCLKFFFHYYYYHVWFF